MLTVGLTAMSTFTVVPLRTSSPSSSLLSSIDFTSGFHTAYSVRLSSRVTLSPGAYSTSAALGSVAQPMKA